MIGKESNERDELAEPQGWRGWSEGNDRVSKQENLKFGSRDFERLL